MLDLKIYGQEKNPWLWLETAAKIISVTSISGHEMVQTVLPMILTYFNVSCIYDMDFCCSWNFGNIVPEQNVQRSRFFEEIFRENIW